jgi:hemerythrin superfamily protein
MDAIALLKADHREVEELFARSEKEMPSATGKRKIVKQICLLLTVHGQIEEEIAYPAFRQAGVTWRVMDEAFVDHATIEELLEQLQGMNASDDHFDAKVKVHWDM